jgi:hypothetical protein
VNNSVANDTNDDNSTLFEPEENQIVGPISWGPIDDEILN